MRKTEVILTAFALSLALGACAAKDDKMAKQAEVEKCFGVAKAGANDCKSGAHDCAGHAKANGDPASFVLLPAGTCGKIAGGKTG